MDVSSIDFKVFIEEQPDDVRTVIEAVIKDPSLISKHGFIKKSELSSALNVSSYFVSKSLKKLQKIMRTYSKEEGCADD
jgi:Mn-dependent DtxR family transcriptional regulator